MGKRWSKAEIAHLKRNADSQSVEELAQRFHTDTDAVRRKLEELGLGSAESSSKAGAEALEDFGKALELLYGNEYAAAAELLEKVIANADSDQLADRARQHLEICRSRTAAETEQGDPYLRAVFEKNNGNLEQALKLCRQQKPAAGDERYAYLMASIRALAGDEDEALGLLEKAIRLEPKNRVYAYHDPDFEMLHARDEFTQLVQGATAAE
jgi:tetratricopeptide (TPR) repeat protein